jgi:O-methyltransferase involved in polyketide biosynthesis
MTETAPLNSVSETLFLPLYALALESQRTNPVMIDPGAVDLTRQLDEMFAGSDTPLHRRLAEGRFPKTLLTTLALRIRHYDRAVKSFINHEPDAVVVNLGCGLDDRRRRVDNGSVRWFDVDLPEVIALRRELLPESERMRFIGSSVLELAWLDLLPKEPGGHFLFVAEGLFMYLPPEGVRTLVIALRDRFPGTELLAEVAHHRIVRQMQSRFGRGKFRRQFSLSSDVVYRFGMGDGREMESWAPGITLLDEWTYFDENDPRLGWMRAMGAIPLFRKSQWTVHYRLGAIPQ